MSEKNPEIQAPQLDTDLLRYFWRYLKSDTGWLIVSFIGLGLQAGFSVLITMIPTILERNWSAGARNTLLWAVGGLFALNFVIIVVQSTTNWLMSRVTENVVRRVKLAIFKKVGLMPSENMSFEAVGKFAQRTTGDVMRLGGLVFPNLPLLLFSLLQLVFMLGALFWIDPHFAWLLPVVTGIMWVVNAKINERVRMWARKDQVQLEDLLTRFIESIGGCRDLVASGRFGNAATEYEGELRAKQRYAITTAWWNNMAGVVPTALFSMLIFGYYIFKILGADFTRQPQIGPILSYAANLSMAQGLVLTLFKVITETEMATPALYELRRVLDAPEVSDVAEEAKIESNGIRFEKVRFGYGLRELRLSRRMAAADLRKKDSPKGTSTNGTHASIPEVEMPADSKLIIKGADFEIRPGSFAAIVGQSGSGKSTIFYMLLRLLDPVDGKIRLGDIPLDEIPLKTLRDYIGFIPQSPFIFNGSIRQNLLMGAQESELPPDRMEYAVKMAHLGELIDKRKAEGGLDAPVGAGGMSLSAGERQRVALGRIFLRDPGVIICDEYTANIDNATARLINESLKTEFKNKTRVVITHQLYTVRGADAIFVLDEGRIVGQGTHDELIKQDGLYREMWDVQHLG